MGRFGLVLLDLICPRPTGRPSDKSQIWEADNSPIACCIETLCVDPEFLG